MVSFFRDRILGGAPHCKVLEVGTADWFGPSSTLVAGLKAQAPDAPLVVIERRNSTSLAPGSFRPRDDKMGPAASTLLAGKPRLTPTPAGLTPPLCRAILSDDSRPLQPVWRALSLDAKTAVVTTAAAVGANGVLRDALAWEPREADLARRPDGGVACNTPLHYAALCGQEESAALLLAQGAEAGASNPVQTQPLHDAARIGHVGLVQQLLAHGADAAAINKYGDHMLHRCALYADQDAARYTAVIQHAVTVVRHAAGFQFLEEHPKGFATRDLLRVCDRAGLAFVNHANRERFTPLDIAVACDQPALARCLGALGARHSAHFLAASEPWTRAHVGHESAWANEEVPLLLAAQDPGSVVAA